MSCGSPVVPRGRTDMTNIIVAFRNFTNEPTKSHTLCLSTLFSDIPLRISVQFYISGPHSEFSVKDSSFSQIN